LCQPEISHPEAMRAFLDYPFRRPAEGTTLFQWAAILSFIFWILFITVVNVAAVGYELVPVVSPSYNATNDLWYGIFIPNQWKPTTRSCEGNVFRLGEGLSFKVTEIGMVTNISGFWDYTLADFLDTRDGVPFDGMIYQNTNIQNCSVGSITLTQSATNPLVDQVSVAWH
jgi:hypothetical protein